MMQEQNHKESSETISKNSRIELWEKKSLYNHLRTILNYKWKFLRIKSPREFWENSNQIICNNDTVDDYLSNLRESFHAMDPLQRIFENIRLQEFQKNPIADEESIKESWRILSLRES